MHKLLSNLCVCYLWTSVAVTSVFGKLRLAHPDRKNHLWTLLFCASFAGTASTVNNWTYSLVDAVYSPKKFFYDCWGSFEDLWQYRKTCFGFLGSLDTSNGAQNNYLTPVWSLIQMYYYQLWVSATWIPQKQLHKVFKILKWAHWLILLDSVTYVLVIAG